MKTYLIFNLNDDFFAINVDYVKNIMKTTKITSIPKTPSYIKGTIDYMNEPVLTIDTCQLMDINKNINTYKYIIICDILFDNYNKKIALLVDDVNVVKDIDNNEIMINNKFMNNLIIGTYQDEKKLIFILNPNKILF